jgi:hypothetical protein
LADAENIGKRGVKDSIAMAVVILVCIKKIRLSARLEADFQTS